MKTYRMTFVHVPPVSSSNLSQHFTFRLRILFRSYCYHLALSHHTDQIRDVGLLIKNPGPSAIRRLLKPGPVSNVCPPFSLQTKSKFFHVALYI